MRKDKIVSLRLTDEEFEYLARWSSNSGKPMSQIIRDMITNSHGLDKIMSYSNNTTATSAPMANIIWEEGEMGWSGMQG